MVSSPVGRAGPVAPVLHEGEAQTEAQVTGTQPLLALSAAHWGPDTGSRAAKLGRGGGPALAPAGPLLPQQPPLPPESQPLMPIASSPTPWQTNGRKTPSTSHLFPLLLSD